MVLREDYFSYLFICMYQINLLYLQCNLNLYKEVIMTQEEKDLLLKDLCGRLPYGVKISVNNKVEILDGIGVLDNVAEYGSFLASDIEEVKPYLFPLSSMTTEQMWKVQNLLPNNCEISFKNQKITFYDEGNIQLEQLEKVFNFFNLFHIDYRGLIEKGLAIDATGLNIY
jgi:hypothetical protein